VLKRSYGPVQCVVLISSLVLVLLAPGASKALGLQTNDDSMCILCALPFFGAAFLASLISLGHRGELIGGLVFCGAWLLQALALHWIEGWPLPSVLRYMSNPSLRAWAIVYVLSVVVFLAAAIWSLCRLSERRGTTAQSDV